MPLRQIPGTEIEYYLISYDEDGRERREPNNVLLSDSVRAAVSDQPNPVTDVFFTSHGWKGDIGSAIEQYDKWVGEMGKDMQDIAEAKAHRPGFRSLVVGLHWPSLPWGDEKIPEGQNGVLGVDDDTQISVDEEVDKYAASIADTAAARSALRTVINASRGDTDSTDIPLEVQEAYNTLYAESQLGTGDVDAPPGSDHIWNPEGIFEEVLQRPLDEGGARPGVLGWGSNIREAILSPIRQISFWKMKDRARRFGERGAHSLLHDLQKVANSKTHFHLMGHSFGCVVVSATVAGPPKADEPAEPVHSLFLVQGALSLWSYCADIEFADHKPGYFSRIVQNHLVEGPIVTTRSKKDGAVSKLYPNAAAVADQVVLAASDAPKYGGIGAWGIQGIGPKTEDMEMQAANYRYEFQPGRIYNLEATDVIKEGGGFSGAHSDIAHPEVAHAMWSAVLTPSE
ncbi:MAG: hypothetical protein ABIQ55_11070 [Gemmatimonadaceae bacterium]